MHINQKLELIREIQSRITPARFDKIMRYAQERTKYLTVVLEDINQTHNISAALRSCDCFAIQQVHIIEGIHKYKVNEGVSRGASKWLDLYKYSQPDINNTQICIDNLKAQGYKIVATTPHEKEMRIDTLPLDNKLAVVFGTEERGLSSTVLEQADYFAKIPMYGFTESFNVSVSVAITLYELVQRLRKSEINWQLSPEEVIDLQLEWLKKSTET